MRELTLDRKIGVADYLDKQAESTNNKVFKSVLQGVALYMRGKKADANIVLPTTIEMEQGQVSDARLHNAENAGITSNTRGSSGGDDANAKSTEGQPRD